MRSLFILLFIGVIYSTYADTYFGVLTNEKDKWLLKQDKNFKQDVLGTILIKEVSKEQAKLSGTYVKINGIKEKCQESTCLRIDSIKMEVYNPLKNLSK